MTPWHLVVESNHITMVKWFLYQGGDIKLQDDNEVILHTNVVNYFQLAGRCCTHCSFTLLFDQSMLDSDLHLE